MSGIPDPNKARVVALWLADLGELTRSGGENALTPQKVKSYAAFLIAGFSSDMFCPASLQAMARKFTWFPAFGELEAALIEWRDEEAVRRKMAARPAIEGPPGVRLSTADQMWVDFYHAHRAEYPEAHWRSLFRARSPAAYAVVFGEPDSDQRDDRGWDNPEGIRQNVQTCLNGPQPERYLRTLAAAVAKFAPQHLALVPPVAWPEDVREEAEAATAYRAPPEPEAAAPERERPPPVTPRHIPDAALLAAYEREATDPAQPYGVRTLAATRAATIRRKLGLPVAANDREKPQEDARP